MSTAPPLPEAPPSLPTADQLVYTPDRRSVRGGTLERLLRWVSLEQFDASRVRAFVYAYRIHNITAQLLWTHLVRLDESVTLSGDKSGIHNFLREWVQATYEVDFKSKDMLRELLDFSSSLSQREANQIKLLCVQRDHLRGSHSVLRRLSGGPPGLTVAQRRASVGAPSQSDGTSSASSSRSSSPPSPPASARHSPPSLPSALSATPSSPSSVFASFKTEVLAGTLTSMVAELMQRVSITEFIHNAWTKPTKAKLAPGLTALTERFNTVSFWVASEILGAASYKPSQRDTPEAREGVRLQAKRLKKAVKLLQRLVELNNFHDAVAIVSGLNLACVQRLKRVWAALDPMARVIFDEVDELLQPNSNWAHYRDLLRSVQARGVPVVPYTALYLRDLTFVQDGNPDTLPESRQLLNWEKIELVGNQIAQFVALRRLPYSFLVVDKRCKLALQTLVPLSEEALLKRSEECEPRRLLPGELPTYEEVCAKDWQQWAPNDVAVWAGHALGDLYIEVFRAGGVDGARLATLDDAALVELGVQKLGHRKRFLKLVHHMRDRNAVARCDDDSSEMEPLSSRSLSVGSGPVSRESSSGAAPPGPATAWSEADVLRWLDAVGEGDCRAHFGGVNGAALVGIDADALERMHVERLGQRKRLLRKIADLQPSGAHYAHHHGHSMSVSAADRPHAHVHAHPHSIERTASLPVLPGAPAALRHWSDADLVHWLEVNDLGEYSRTFAQQHMTAVKLLELTEEQLARLGVTKLGHRKRLQRLLDDLRHINGNGSVVRLPSSP